MTDSQKWGGENVRALYDREIRCVVYESRRLLKWSWRFKFVAPNGEKLGHQYNSLADALLAINSIGNPNVPLRLIVINRYRVVDNRGLIR